MRIPKKIKLGSRIFKVEISDKFVKDHNIYGQAHFGKQKILIDNNPDYPMQNQEITFLHEWLHMALTQVGEDELSENESFVDKLSEKLHELITQLEK